MSPDEIREGAEPENPEWSGEKTLEEKPGKLAGKIALRDHVILQNEYYFEIKEGDDLTHIPDRFYQTLKTEKLFKE